MYSDEELLPLSGVQHYAFCPRQWGLICLEQEWLDNALTVQGELFHARAHDAVQRERRGSVITVRGLLVRSYSLGLIGVCDVVEFHADSRGCSINGEEGLWLPVPIEYKRGKSKDHNADRLQLCAQAMCLESMLCCDISEGFLFYGKTKSRELVKLEKGYREQVSSIAASMHDLHRRQHVPKARKKSVCGSCSLADRCLSSVSAAHSVERYMAERLREGGL